MAAAAAAAPGLLEVTEVILSSGRSRPLAAVVAAPTMTRMGWGAVRVAAVATASVARVALKGRQVGTRVCTAAETKAASVLVTRGTEAGAAVLATWGVTAHLRLVETVDLGKSPRRPVSCLFPSVAAEIVYHQPGQSHCP